LRHSVDGDLSLRIGEEQRLWLAVIIPHRSGKGRLYLQPRWRKKRENGDGHCSAEISWLQVHRAATAQHFNMEQTMMMTRCS